MDKTMVVGRWENGTTARIYIEQAAAEVADMKLTPAQRKLLSESAQLLVPFK